MVVSVLDTCSGISLEKTLEILSSKKFSIRLWGALVSPPLN